MSGRWRVGILDERLHQGRLTFYNTEFCSYPEGYVDGKFLRMDYLEQVAEKGSEPARFAFQDARVLLSRGGPLERELQSITRYPVEGKSERLRRFNAQLEAWNWYGHEALRLDHTYLLSHSIGKLVLFGGRMVLAHNELLYPYHKWFLRVLETAEDKPPSLMETIESLYQDPSAESIHLFYERVKHFQDWGEPENGWPAQFMLDNELNWQTGPTPIDDL